MTTIIERKLQKQIENSLFKRKVIIIYGARQVGKTTIVKQIIKRYPEKSIYFNCDEPDVREALTNKTSTEIKAFIGDHKLVVIDEAQRVRDIGLALKLMVDNFPEIQIIATVSSSFELSNRIVEPLTGRRDEFMLYPLSLEELRGVYSDLEINRLLNQRIIYGMYPEIVIKEGEAGTRLKDITTGYLFKDVLQFHQLRHAEVIEKLLQALALQVGNEVSYTELSQLLGIDKQTVASYIRILEQAFIVFTLKPFSRNLRNELKKMRKIYFYDTGIRNAVINNLNPINLRNDIGALWENFIIAERYKFLANNNKDVQKWFWRTHQGKEIDYLEDSGGILNGYEIKWQEDKYREPKEFINAYPGSQVKLINKNNMWEFVA